MTALSQGDGGRRGFPWRIVGWGGAAALLSLPAILNFPWDETDFIVMGVLMGGVGLAIEGLVRVSRNTAYRLGAVVALLTVFLTIWANLAVGMINSEDHAYNLVFAGVIGMAVLGGAATLFRPAGMARATAAAAVAQALASLVGMTMDLRGGIFSLFFAGFWLLAAALFHKAARDGA